jgi:hypothetical protein
LHNGRWGAFADVIDHDMKAGMSIASANLGGPMLGPRCARKACTSNPEGTP